MYTWKRLVSSPMTVTKLLIYFRFISTYLVDKCKYIFFLTWTNGLPLLSISRNCAHIRILLTFLTTWEIFREDFSRSFFFFPFFIYFLNFRYTKTFLSVSKLEEYDGTVQPKKEKREKKKKYDFYKTRQFTTKSPPLGPHKCTMGRIVFLITESASTHCSGNIKGFWKCAIYEHTFLCRPLQSHLLLSK